MFERFRRNKEDEYKGTMLAETDVMTAFLEDETPSTKAPRRKKHGNSGRKYNPGGRLETMNAIIAYLSTREGKKTSYQNIADKLGIANSYANILTGELVGKKTISRTGRRGSYKFKVNHKRVNRPRKATPKAKTPAKVSMPRVDTASEGVIEKVFSYISRNEDRLVTQKEIATAIGTSDWSVNRAILELVADKRIVRSEPVTGGSRYWLWASAYQADQPAEESPTSEATESAKENRLEATSNNSQLSQVVDSLVWEYIKDTGNMSVVGFVQWLAKLEQ